MSSPRDPLTTPEFWGQRDELARIRDYARAYGASPAAMLAATIMRVLAQTPPNVVLPPIVGGSYGSLNAYAALVTGSGGGKGASTSAARNGVLFGQDETFHETQPGSGEGLVRTFARNKKDENTGLLELEWIHQQVLFDVAEVTDLSGQMGRSGATLEAQLLRAFVGEPLGFSYAGAENSVRLPRGEYRFTMIAGVQASRSEVLLGDDRQGSGFPQRFIWAETDDVDAPDYVLDRMRPEPLTLDLPSWPLTTQVIGVDDSIRYAIGQNRVRTLRGEAGGLDGHRMFLQEKVGAALSIMRGGRHVTEDDWAVAGDIMIHSDLTRARCVDALEAKRNEEMRRRGALDDQRQVGKERSKFERDVDRCERRIVRVINADTTVSASDIYKGFASRDRAVDYNPAAEALQRLAARGVRIPGFDRLGS